MVVRGKKTMEFEGSQPIVNVVLFLKFPTSFPFWTDHQGPSSLNGRKENDLLNT